MASSELNPKKSKSFPIWGGILVLTFIACAGGAYVSYPVVKGLLKKEENASHSLKSAENSYLAIPPVLMSFLSGSDVRYVKFVAQLEVSSGQYAIIEAEMPRILDIINGYMRLLKVDELNKETALITLKSQILRRVRLMPGGDSIKNILVSELVIT